MVGFLKEGVAGRDGGRMRKEEEEKKVELERGGEIVGHVEE